MHITSQSKLPPAILEKVVALTEIYEILKSLLASNDTVIIVSFSISWHYSMVSSKDSVVSQHFFLHVLLLGFFVQFVSLFVDTSKPVHNVETIHVHCLYMVSKSCT